MHGKECKKDQEPTIKISSDCFGICDSYDSGTVGQKIAGERMRAAVCQKLY